MSYVVKKPLNLPVPFAPKEGIGLGDVIKRATGAVGIKPCGGCQKRAERLNRLLRLRRMGS